MDAKRPIALATLFLSTACLLTGRTQIVQAQGLRTLLQERFQEQNQAQQQNQNPQQVPGQQPYAGGQPNPVGGQYPLGQPNLGSGQFPLTQPNGAGGQYPVAQPSPAEVSVVNLQTQQGPNGQQMVVTPKGMVVPLPGPGVNGPMVPIYIGGTGGYWYVDKNGQQVDLTPAVHALQASSSHMGTQYAPPPQYSPPPQYAPQQQVVNVGSTGTSGSSAAGTAAMAGVGAMTGAMLGSAITGSNNSYVPYGTPIHYGAGAAPYYNQGGKPVYVNNSTNVEGNDLNNYHAQAMKQQDWYHQQQAQQTSNWKNWQQQKTSNPFVRSEYEGEGQAASHANEVHGAENAGRFGRFGHEGTAAQEDANKQSQENRLNRRESEGEGRFGRRR